MEEATLRQEDAELDQAAHKASLPVGVLLWSA